MNYEWAVKQMKSEKYVVLDSFVYYLKNNKLRSIDLSMMNSYIENEDYIETQWSYSLLSFEDTESNNWKLFKKPTDTLSDKEQIIQLIESQVAGYEFVLDIKAANVCRIILKKINK